MIYKEIKHKYKHCCYQFDNHLIPDEKEDLACACLEDTDGRMIFENYIGSVDSHFFNFCPFCGYKGQVKNDNFEMEKRLTKEEIAEIEKSAQDEVRYLKEKTTFDEMFESLSKEEKKQFYLDHIDLLEKEIRIVKSKLRDLMKEINNEGKAPKKL